MKEVRSGRRQLLNETAFAIIEAAVGIVIFTLPTAIFISALELLVYLT